MTANALGKRLVSLFKTEIFLPIAVILMMILGLLLLRIPFSALSTETINVASDIDFIKIIPLMVVIVFAHEMGHISALNYGGEQSNGIGFGFYLFTPVFYADVSSAWRLNHKQRMVVDAGGIYFQLIVTGVITIMYTISGDVNFLYVVIISVITIAYNLIPFFRTDGYWLFCDAINTPISEMFQS